MFDGSFNISDTQQSRNLESEKAVAITRLYEGKLSLENWPYDVILESGTTSYTLLRNSTNYTATYYNTSSQA